MTIGDSEIREDAQRQTPQVASRLPEHTTVVRVESVDALRGLTILLMVFVNDLSPAAPTWMHHTQPQEADGMTLADIVFPGFLFIVGMGDVVAFVILREMS